MKSGDKENALTLNTPLILAMAVSLGMWGLLYLGGASVWSRLVNHSEVAVEERSTPQLASLTDQSQVKLPARSRVKATRKRRFGPSLAARVFNRSTSLN